MLFDGICGSIEKHYEKLMPVLQKARLFDFDVCPHDVLPKTFDEDMKEFITEHFFLPFSTVAIEDKATCTLLWDHTKRQKGLKGLRYFLDAQPVLADPKLFRKDERDGYVSHMERQEEIVASAGVSLDEFKHALIIVVGRVFDVRLEVPDQIWIEGQVDIGFIADKHTMFVTPREFAQQAGIKDLYRAGLRNAQCAMQEIVCFNSPDRWIVERTPVKIRGRRKKSTQQARILRSHQRPQYTLLTPKEVREVIRLPEEAGKHASPGGHERRRHYRTYDPVKNPKWKSKKTIVIAAAWIGPSSAVVGKHRWKVRLDL